ncbi:MAG: DUF4435 domain-containing protein [Magnetospirillum sp. WYHS-4]
MGSFSDFSDSRAVVHLHSGAVTIFVEGASDVAYLEKMFPDSRADIRFEEVGGCTAIRARLAKERPANPKVIGLLDRDALMREKRWLELFETDNDDFASATRLDGIYVLTRWEIENYLLDLAAVWRLFENWKASFVPNEDKLLDLMIEAALGELHVTAGWCTAHQRGIPQHTGPGSCVDIEVLESKVREWIMSQQPDAETEYDQHLTRVKAFDPGTAAEKRERLAALMRMVDGKRFVERLQRRWLDVNKDPSPQLADNVGQRHPRSDDLFEIVDGLRQST